MSLITTHILDNSTGSPASGVAVSLSDEKGEELGRGVTDDDGRVGEIGPEELSPGTYRLTFVTGEYFKAKGQRTFFPEVTLSFSVEAGEAHYHVPLLLSPFAYSTYRGS